MPQEQAAQAAFVPLQPRVYPPGVQAASMVPPTDISRRENGR
jgi:hypothetical protein